MTLTASQADVAAELGGLKAELEVAWAGLVDYAHGLANEDLARHVKRVHVSSDRYYGAIARVMKAYVQHRDASRAESQAEGTTTDKYSSEVNSRDAA